MYMQKRRNFHQFYCGTTPDFNEYEYLTDISRLRYELEKLLIKYGIIQNTTKQVVDLKVFDGQDYRIPKNGGIQIYSIEGRPCGIRTPYGTLKVSKLDRGYVYNVIDPVKQASFEKEVKEMFGLRILDSFQQTGIIPNKPKHAVRFEKMNVTKLPWKEKAIPQAGETYLTHRVPTEFTSYIESIHLLAEKYGSVHDYARLLSEEGKHVEKCLQLVSMDLIEKGHKEYVIPEMHIIEKNLQGGETLENYMQKYPEAAQKRKQLLIKGIKQNQDLEREM